MSDRWQRYVEQAAPLLDPGAFDRLDPHHAHWAMQQRREVSEDRARRILAQVGPQIAADTTERVVAAAKRAVEQEGARR